MRAAFIAIAMASLSVVPASAQLSAHPVPAPVAPVSPETQRTLDRLSARALESELAYSLVEDLVTTVGPRLAGSEQEARAREWAARMLRAQGFQNVRVEEFTIPFWDATREEAMIIAPTQQRIVIAALGGSASTPAGGLEAEIVRFASIEALQAAPDSAVAGRIVFIDERMTRTQGGEGYGLAVRKRSRCAPTAQDKGAAACLIRAVGTDGHRFAHQGGGSRQAGGASLPAAAISPADADQLARLVARGRVRVRLDIETEFGERTSGNVIGEIRGRERPEEIILLAAHLDSWDLGQGAIDDGAGVAIITAAARLIREMPRRPRRTIRVLLSGAEETGTYGGPAYARMHGQEPHIVGAESDFGAGRIYRARVSFNTREYGQYRRAIQRALAPLGIAGDDLLADGGADTAAIHKAGMPVVDLAQDGTDYFDYHHTPDDTLDKIDPEALAQNVAAYAVFAYLAAESDWVFRAPPAPETPPPPEPPTSK